MDIRAPVEDRLPPPSGQGGVSSRRGSPSSSGEEPQPAPSPPLIPQATLLRRGRPAPMRRPTGRRMLLRYSRFVGAMKVVLPALAAALLGLVVVWPRLQTVDERFRLAFANFNPRTIDTLSMQKPHYYGTDDKNLPFTVTADIATQVDPQNLVVSLENPVTDLTQKDGSGVVINSDVGFFRQKDDTLDLMGHVDLYQDSGYEVHSDSARVDIARGNASGDEPTHGQGSSGTIEGEGFRLWDRGKVIVFTGKAKAVLHTAKAKGGDGKPEAKASRTAASPPPKTKTKSSQTGGDKAK